MIIPKIDIPLFSTQKEKAPELYVFEQQIYVSQEEGINNKSCYI